MRKQLVLPIIISFIFVSACWLFSCQKPEHEITPESPASSTEETLSSLQRNDELLNLLANNLDKQIAASEATENINTFAGYPNWQQSIIVERDDAGSRSKKKKAKAIIYTPFARKNERKTSAILQSTISETDTSLQVIYPQNYLQFGFNTNSDTTWDARDLFNIFAFFDDRIYGVRQYIINDGRIFGANETDTLIVLVTSVSSANGISARVSDAGSKWAPVTICVTTQNKVYASSSSSGTYGSSTSERCTIEWVESGGGGSGGSAGSGGGGSGGGTSGSASNNLNTTPCPTPNAEKTSPVTTVPPPVTGTQTNPYTPCPDVWEPVDYVINNLENKCLKAALEKLLKNSGTLFSDIYNLFDDSKTLHLSLTEAALTDAYGKTWGVTQLPNGESSVTIQMDNQANNSSLLACSNEWMAYVFIHEIAHAGMKVEGISWDQNNSEHVAMAGQFLDKMAGTLTKAYPSLSKLDAYAMCFSGFTNGIDGVPSPSDLAFSMIIMKKINLKLQTNYTNTQLSDLGNKYTEIGTKGTRTKCY